LKVSPIIYSPAARCSIYSASESNSWPQRGQRRLAMGAVVLDFGATVFLGEILVAGTGAGATVFLGEGTRVGAGAGATVLLGEGIRVGAGAGATVLLGEGTRVGAGAGATVFFGVGSGAAFGDVRGDVFFIPTLRRHRSQAAMCKP